MGKAARIAGIGIFLILWSFSGSSRGMQAGTPSQDELARAYAAAVRDASVVEAGENLSGLTVIDSHNPNIVWNDKHSEILVVTWKSQGSFLRFYKDSKTTSPQEDLVTWVTAAPEMKKICEEFAKQSKDPAALNLRLKQFLGLDPSWQYDVFVEMWVRPSDMFRPCPDPEITDSQCNLKLSETSPKVPHIKDYNAFFRNLYYKSFRSGSVAPWTGLGYTYDWGNPATKKGASEFILVPKAKYTIRGQFPTVDYCS